MKGKTFQYLRINGINIPGYHSGSFMFTIEKERFRILSFSTSLNDLILIKMNNGVNYGISPENGDLFYDSIKKAKSQVNLQVNTQLNSFNNPQTDPQLNSYGNPRINSNTDVNLQKGHKKIGNIFFIIKNHDVFYAKKSIINLKSFFL